MVGLLYLAFPVTITEGHSTRPQFTLNEDVFLRITFRSHGFLYYKVCVPQISTYTHYLQVHESQTRSYSAEPTPTDRIASTLYYVPDHGLQDGLRPLA
jgi:hypothetical protein